MDEGVIKYRLDFKPGPALPAEWLTELLAWQRILHDLGLVGRDAARYGGLAYGNLSVRLAGGGFAISASQTADKPLPAVSDYSRVISWDCRANQLVAEGPLPPSSESLTHAALYEADPAIGCVMHVHSPLIWRTRASLHLASTAPDIPYGTPQMATEAVRLYRERGFNGQGILAMGGHQDGVVSFGEDPDRAGCSMLLALRRALSQS